MMAPINDEYSRDLGARLFVGLRLIRNHLVMFIIDSVLIIIVVSFIDLFVI